jgi:hypothetical protein
LDAEPAGMTGSGRSADFRVSLRERPLPAVAVDRSDVG